MKSNRKYYRKREDNCTEKEEKVAQGKEKKEMQKMRR